MQTLGKAPSQVRSRLVHIGPQTRCDDVRCGDRFERPAFGLCAYFWGETRTNYISNLDNNGCSYLGIHVGWLLKSPLTKLIW